MRIPEYRAWNKDKNEMVEVTMILFHSEEIDYKTNYNEPYHWDHFEMMLSIGRRDKNNIKIFAGDIIKIEMDQKAHGGGGWTIIGEIIYQGYGFKFKELRLSGNILSAELKTEHLDNASYMNEWEVIGNIYENKELLK